MTCRLDCKGVRILAQFQLICCSIDLISSFCCFTFFAHRMLASLIKVLHGICQMGFCIFAIDKGIFSEILASCECKLFQTYLSGVYLSNKSHTHLQESCQDLNFNVKGIKKSKYMIISTVRAPS